MAPSPASRPRPRLSHRLTPETIRSVITDARTPPQQIVTRLAPCWAAVEPWRRAVGDAGAPRDYRVTLRARRDLDVGDRLHYDGRILLLAALLTPPTDGHYLVCLCREMAAP